MVYLGTARYNKASWQELQTYIDKNSIKGCIYNVPIRIASIVPVRSEVIIMEMDNDNNTIKAIGLIENYLRVDKYHKIHKIGNYNRYSYLGNHRILRENFTDQEEMVFKVFDYLVFKGSGHMKRGQGITCISDKKIKNHYVENKTLDEYVYGMFKRRFCD